MKVKRYLASLINKRTLKEVWIDVGVETKEDAINELEHKYPHLKLMYIGEWKPEAFRKSIMEEKGKRREEEERSDGRSI